MLSSLGKIHFLHSFFVQDQRSLKHTKVKHNIKEEKFEMYCIETRLCTSKAIHNVTI